MRPVTEQVVKDKLQDIANWDEVRKLAAQAASSTEEDAGYLARLGKKIVDNLQVRSPPDV